MHYTRMMLDDQTEDSVSFEQITPREEEDFIDFEAILMEGECFFAHAKPRGFLGDSDESTEIDSIVNSIATDQNATVNPFRIEETESEEIFGILKRQPENEEYVRAHSNSNPIFYNNNRKTISLKGRVILSDNNLRCLDKEQSSAVRPRPVPQRVSNPFMRNFDASKKDPTDSLKERIYNNDNLQSSKFK